MAYYIYIFLCAFSGFILSTANITIADWQFWVETLCLVGAWICGKEYSK